MPYKVGQKVILLKGKGRHGTIIFASGMECYVGKVAILAYNSRYELAHWLVWVNGIDTGYSWHEDWFRHVGCPCQVKNCIAKHKES